MSMSGAAPSDIDHLRWLDATASVEWTGRSVLDIGCGSGFLCAELMRRGARAAVGIDMREPSVKADSWVFRKMDLEDRQWPRQFLAESPFDIITAFDLIEHLSSPWLLLSQMHALLAPTGQLILTTPNANSWERLLRPTTWSGAHDKQHKTLFTRYSLAFILDRSGFVPTKLIAPVRKLARLGALVPGVGAQIFVVCQKKAPA